MGTGEMGLFLRLSGCAGISGPADVVPIASVLGRHGFIPGDGVGRNIAPAADLPGMVTTHTLKHSGRGAGWSVGFPLLAAWSKSLTAPFECTDIGDRMTFTGLAKLFDAKEATAVEPFAQRLLGLASDLYSVAKPALAWIDAFHANNTLTGDVRKVRLRTVSWANFFGPPYVDRYGRDLVMGIPGHRAQEMPDGGVFHQLTPTFLVEDGRAARSLRQSVKDHFTRAGLKVTCRAPFVRSQVFGREEEAPLVAGVYGTLEEFRAGLAQLLATTLVLRDGTRVKVLYLNWSELPREHRKLALATVRQVARAELADNPLARIRFEFSEIPPDLRSELEELKGANPRLSYEQVAFSRGLPAG